MSAVRRLVRMLRVEDLVLVLLAAVVLPALDVWLPGAGGEAPGSTGPSVLEGLVGLVAVAGVVACVLTRGPDEPSPLTAGSLTLQGWARFPLAAGVGIVTLEVLPGIGLDADPIVGIMFVLTVAGAILHPRLPVVPVPWRRAMVLPMTILAAGAFDAIIGRDLDDLAVELLQGSPPPEVLAFWPLILGAVAALYVMLVVAPRAIADPGSSGLAWAVRFAFLLGSVAVAALLGVR